MVVFGGGGDKTTHRKMAYNQKVEGRQYRERYIRFTDGKRHSS